MHTLCKAVLLWSPMYGQVPLNLFCVTETIELTQTNLQTIISVKTFYPLSSILLNHYFLLLEGNKHISFLLQEKN